MGQLSGLHSKKTIISSSLVSTKILMSECYLSIQDIPVWQHYTVPCTVYLLYICALKSHFQKLSSVFSSLMCHLLGKWSLHTHSTAPIFIRGNKDPLRLKWAEREKERCISELVTGKKSMVNNTLCGFVVTVSFFVSLSHILSL